MKFLYGCSTLSLATGILLQQTNHFVLNSHIEPHYDSKIKRFLIFLGLLLEILSLSQLPLCTYVLLNSLHLLVFKHTLIKDEKRSATPAENLGSIAIISGCLITFLFGPEQGVILTEDFTELFDLYYYTYTIASLFLSFLLRRLNFFAGKILIETGLISQISSFPVCAVKIFWIHLFATGLQGGLYIFLCISTVIVGSLISNSFVRMLLATHDVVVVMGGYFMWSLFYCLPLSFFFRSGVEFSALNAAALLFGSCLILPGVYFHTFTKIEYLKAYKENKLSKLPDFIV